MKCAGKTSKGRCQMPRLRGDRFCWAHSDKAAAQRAEARRKGGRATADRQPRREQTIAPPLAAPTAPFALGQLERRVDIPASMLRVARAVSSGELDVRRGRLLGELLRGAAFAFSITPEGAADDDAPPGCRAASAAELAYIAKSGGKLPKGIEVHGASFWVRGAERRGGPKGDDPDGEPDA